MELQWFIQDDAEEADKWYRYWVDVCMKWLTNHNINPTMIRAREHNTKEVAHYANYTTDIEFNFPGLGWGELWGIADRGTYDLEQHIDATSGGGDDSKHPFDPNADESTQKKWLKQEKKRKKKKEKKMKTHPLLYLDSKTGKRSIPRVIEPAVGLTRVFLAVLSSAMHVETIPNGDGEHEGETERTVLKLHPRLAPIKIAVLPLLKNRIELMNMSEEIFATLASKYACELDATGSIGKRYRKQDEIGTPICITIDVDSVTDQKVTVRDRDSLKQVRVAFKEIEQASLEDLLKLFR